MLNVPIGDTSGYGELRTIQQFIVGEFGNDSGPGRECARSTRREPEGEAPPFPAAGGAPIAKPSFQQSWKVCSCGRPNQDQKCLELGI